MMVDFDFNRGASKLEKDQQKRREEARKKRLTEERLRKEKQERDEALIAFKKAELERQQAALLLKELADRQELNLTGGINLQRTFTFGYIYLAESETDDDKIILPEDCLQELSQQDAFSFGPMTFMLTNTNVPDKVSLINVIA